MENKVLKSKKYQKEFKDFFGFNAPIDMLLTACFGYVVIDVIALDSALKVPDGISTKDFIVNEYGNDAAQLVSNWISL